MSNLGPFQGIPLPKNWPQHIKLAVIRSVALSHRAITSYGQKTQPNFLCPINKDYIRK
jgi:hypothetical protein